MGTTAENVAARFGVSREDQDAFAYNSHRKASIAREKGLLAQEIIPVDTFVDGKAVRVEHDELIRPDTTAEGLKGLKPAFKPVGAP
jgi:acetyl-CoA acetyltransferase